MTAPSYRRAYWAKQQAKWRADHPGYSLKYQRAYRKRHRARLRIEDRLRMRRLRKLPAYQRKIKARTAVHNAVRDGKLKKLDRCESCNRKTKLQGHHFRGYAKKNWLCVRWLCRSCH